MSQRCSLILLFSAVCFVKCSTKPLPKLLGIVVGPEVHKEDPWLLIEHVVVKRYHLDVVLTQGLNHGLHLVLRHGKVAVDCGLTPTCWLEVKRGGDACRRGQLHPVLSDRISTTDAVLIHAALGHARVSYGLIKL